MKRIGPTILLAFIASLAMWAAAGAIAFSFAEAPPRYDQMTRVEVLFTTKQNARALCAWGGVEAEACVLGEADKLVIMPHPSGYRGEFAELMRHELAHVNGWPATHE